MIQKNRKERKKTGADDAVGAAEASIIAGDLWRRLIKLHSHLVG